MSSSMDQPTPARTVGLFLLLQVGLMLMAISHESFWIDEFWNAYFASLKSVKQLYEGLSEPYGSQTPLHFIYGYFWGILFPQSELGFRLSNLPLFVMGQASLFWALRPYPKPLMYWFLGLCALHPMVWQYANEFRPYIMIYAGSEMILAYILHLHTTIYNGAHFSPIAPIILVVGSILLFGASLLGVFWVIIASLYIGCLHYLYPDWCYLKKRLTVLLACAFFVINGLLALYYVNSLLQGGGASRLASTTLTTLLFDAYELLGLSGLGPGRLELRDTGFAALNPYWMGLACGGLIILGTLAKSVRDARIILGTRRLGVMFALSISPIVIIIASGFIMHWRVLGRHMIATLPLLNLLIALALTKLCEVKEGRGWLLRRMVAMGFLLIFVYSSLSLRFAERHRKDDYRAATAAASQELMAGKRVWWAADALGARYYNLPGEFDYMGELTNVHRTYDCIDRSGVQAVSGASANCLDQLAPPDMVILSKPDTFDRDGVISSYLKARNYVAVRELPAFTILQPSRGK